MVFKQGPAQYDDLIKRIKQVAEEQSREDRIEDEGRFFDAEEYYDGDFDSCFNEGITSGRISFARELVRYLPMDDQLELKELKELEKE